MQQDLAAVRTLTKDDRSPVTVADFASQALVTATLLERLGRDFEKAALVAEEDSSFLRRDENASYRAAVLRAMKAAGRDVDEATMLRWIDRGAGEPGVESFWTLDPIDGTKGFLRGEQYAIALAWIDHGVPAVGVLACPNLPLDREASLSHADEVGSVYVAVRGSGVEQSACLLSVSDARRKLEPLGPVGTRRLVACASVEKAHSSVSDTERVLERMGAEPEVIRVDSSAKYALVARGQADAYLRLPTRKDYVERIWDHAAGTVVATEVGAVVSDIFGHPLDFRHGRGLEKNKGVIVTRADVHPRIVQTIAELGIGG